ncbi:sigma-70 family RNA polymerase sigma factor [Nocardiopsis sp. CNT-189]|uniref:RNA polymerase sigma factor n=1 Tax=Nocardiopsis oceanisediminis TaxID=2816862 RepID=UPI003B29A1E4
MALILQAEQEEWRLLVQEMGPKLAAYLQKIGAGVEEARDAYQTALTGAWRRRREIDDLRAYIWVAAKNAYLKSPAEPSPVPLGEVEIPLPACRLPDFAVERREELRRVLKAMQKLPFDQRDALAQAASGFRSAEIAKNMGRTEQAVRQLVSRGRARLKQILAAEGGEG